MYRDNPQRVFDTLLQRAKEGDKIAFGGIYELWADKIYRYCYRRAGEKETAADLTSEIFLRIWQSLPDFNGDGFSFSPWAYRVAENLANDYFRKNKITAVPIEEIAELAASEDPFESFDIKFDAKLEGALQSLSEEFRRAIELRYIKNLSFGQIARQMHKKEGTVRTTISRALSALRKKLAK